MVILAVDDSDVRDAFGEIAAKRQPAKPSAEHDDARKISLRLSQHGTPMDTQPGRSQRVAPTNLLSFCTRERLLVTYRLAVLAVFKRTGQ
jgi:hypothetical protein